MNTPAEMPTRYDALESEPRWYPRWEASGLLSPTGIGEPYCITIPPPNITGSLHMGHALCYGIHDCLGRYWRLRGRDVLILPGQDHAGIATQSLIDRKLRAEGTSAAQIGRAAFLERTWSWRVESGDTILRQMRALGCAFDWSRLRFTLDNHYADAVLRIFVDWFDRGLIFRGRRIVNWDPKLQTTVSDIETVRMERAGKLYHVRYRFEDGSGEVQVATTRPETILGDVAVAVHPSDDRYRSHIGKTLIAPLTGRRIPLIADIYPDSEFGTGALKITPAHDAADDAVGRRHGLTTPETIGLDARITLDWIRKHEPAMPLDHLVPFEGQDRFAARKLMVAALAEQGSLVREEDHTVALSISDRSGEVIEPLLMEQWFVDQAKLAAPVIKALDQGEIRIRPSRYERVLRDWLVNVHEWCISRQLWWGHRIPIYYTEEGEAFAGLSLEDAQVRAGAKNLVRQEDDVLDTWFSSGLWPFATLGWPPSSDDSSTDLERFYPTNVLITDRDIIALWVARMAMAGYDVMDAPPFREVFIYATVLTEKGERMSKSKGTGVDPTAVMSDVGADALRYVLFSQTGENQELRFRSDKVIEGRNFANKIWNATRFALQNVHETPARPEHFEAEDRWILGRLRQTEREVSTAYEQYNFQVACDTLYRFFWDEVCDWYIEIVKERLADETASTTPAWVLLKVISAFLTMLHPVMPYLTEELHSFLPVADRNDLLLGSRWPDLSDLEEDPEATASVERAIAATRAIRNLRNELEIPPREVLPLVTYEGDVSGTEPILLSQARIASLRRGRPQGNFVSVHAGGLDLHLPTENLDLSRLLESLDRERVEVERAAENARGKLANSTFTDRAKPEVVEKERTALANAEARLERLLARRALFAPSESA